MLGQRLVDDPLWRMLPMKELMLSLARPPKLGEAKDGLPLFCQHEPDQCWFWPRELLRPLHAAA
ncbi:hypothetical protein F6B41_23110 [Microbacterium lushaniae]|nr:hypothetical protein F6B41_23110 [Microbacterium lushaniae]